MPFPANQSQQREGWYKAQAIAGAVKLQATQVRDQTAAGPIARATLIDFMRQLDRHHSLLGEIAGIAGIQDYARREIDDPARDIVGEFITMRAAIAALRDWVEANFPKTGQAWLVYSYDSSGAETSLTFTTAQTVGFRTACDDLIATIG